VDPNVFSAVSACVGIVSGALAVWLIRRSDRAFDEQRRWDELERAAASRQDVGVYMTSSECTGSGIHAIGGK